MEELLFQISFDIVKCIQENRFDELEKMGINEGDIVRILDYEFEYTK